MSTERSQEKSHTFTFPGAVWLAVDARRSCKGHQDRVEDAQSNWGYCDTTCHINQEANSNLCRVVTHSGKQVLH